VDPLSLVLTVQLVLLQMFVPQQLLDTILLLVPQLPLNVLFQIVLLVPLQLLVPLLPQATHS